MYAVKNITHFSFCNSFLDPLYIAPCIVLQSHGTFAEHSTEARVGRTLPRHPGCTSRYCDTVHQPLIKVEPNKKITLFHFLSLTLIK